MGILNQVDSMPWTNLLWVALEEHFSEDIFAAEVSLEFYFFYCDKAGILFETKGANIGIALPLSCCQSNKITLKETCGWETHWGLGLTKQQNSRGWKSSLQITSSYLGQAGSPRARHCPLRFCLQIGETLQPLWATCSSVSSPSW